MSDPSVSVTPTGGATITDSMALSLSDSVAATARTQVQATESVTFTMSDPSVSVATGGATITDSMALSISDSVATNPVSDYEQDFFTADLYQSAAQCGPSICEINTQSDSENDSTDGSIENQTLEVTFDTGAVSGYGSGSVTIRYYDNSGQTELGRKTYTFSGSGAANTTHTFTDTAPTGAVFVQIEREVIANSQNTSGNIPCESDSDCSFEEATIEHPITVTQQ